MLHLLRNLIKELTAINDMILHIHIFVGVRTLTIRLSLDLDQDRRDNSQRKYEHCATPSRNRPMVSRFRTRNVSVIFRRNREGCSRVF